MIRGIRYHERVQDEISEILRFYSAISDQLADDFLFQVSPSLIKVTVVRHNSLNPGYGSGRK
jgi:hypothetical protein